MNSIEKIYLHIFILGSNDVFISQWFSWNNWVVFLHEIQCSKHVTHITSAQECFVVEVLDDFIMNQSLTDLLSFPFSIHSCSKTILSTNKHSNWHLFDVIKLELWWTQRSIFNKVLCPTVIVHLELTRVDQLGIVEELFGRCFVWESVSNGLDSLWFCVLA